MITVLGSSPLGTRPSYIQQLPAEEKKYIGSIQLFEDGTGQHAAQIEVDLHGTQWAHVLIYDRETTRLPGLQHATAQESMSTASRP